MTTGDPLVAASATVAGEPGETVTVTGPEGTPEASCELIDRSGVQVQLLPS
ncbi:MAG: hypothetical protein AAFY15_14250 [Cyanobacteria bacterium J06648_11]